jgi:hypothetical protein
MLMRFPPLPPPFRGAYKSDDAYQKALHEWEQLMERRRESSKTDLAIMLLFASVLVLVVVVMVFFAVWITAGIRGFGYLFAVAGLLWVAFIQIRRRL